MASGTRDPSLLCTTPRVILRPGASRSPSSPRTKTERGGVLKCRIAGERTPSPSSLPFPRYATAQNQIAPRQRTAAMTFRTVISSRSLFGLEPNDEFELAFSVPLPRPCPGLTSGAQGARRRHSSRRKMPLIFSVLHSECPPNLPARLSHCAPSRLRLAPPPSEVPFRFTNCRPQSSPAHRRARQG